VNQTVAGAVELSNEGPLVVLKFRRTRSDLQAILDLESDGSLETIETSFPTTTTVHDRSGDQACTMAIPYCDCAC
jgi:hypothetical protein